MKIKIIEGYYSELDLIRNSDDIEEPQPPRVNKAKKASKPKRSLMDMFDDYVNHSNNPAAIYADGRIIRPNIVDNMLKSFRKRFNCPNFMLQTASKFNGYDYDIYIIDPKYDNPWR